MGAFVDRYHDVHHRGTTVDLINCPVCQDEFIEASVWSWHADGSFSADRLEDLPEYEGVVR